MNDLNFQFFCFNIIYGIDGSYIVKAGKLVKIVKREVSTDYYKVTGGWQKIYLEDGTIIKIGG